MTTPEADGNVSLENRLALLRAIPSVASVDHDTLVQVANCLLVERFGINVTILRESTFGDRLYLIQSGVVGVYTDGPAGIVQLGKLSVGDRFGEVSLQRSMRRKRTTIKTLTPVVALTLSTADYDHFISKHPEIHLDLASALDSFMEGRFAALMQANALKNAEQSS